MLPEDLDPPCAHEAHRDLSGLRASESAIEWAVRLFRALGDASRLRTLELLMRGEACVSEIAAASEESVSTVSHRLRLLRVDGLVLRRRQGRHVYYSLADQHVVDIVRNALAHAEEDRVPFEPSAPKEAS